MSNPTRSPSGISTAGITSLLANFPMPAPFNSGSLPTVGVVTYASDFLSLPTGEYTRTTVGTGTLALGSVAGGAVVLTTTAGIADSETDVKVGKAFSFVAGQRAWFHTRFQMDNATLPLVQIGLQDAAVAADGLYFTKAAGSTSINLVKVISSTATTLVTGVATAVANTWFDLGYYYDGVALNVFVNDVQIARVDSSVALTTALLTPVLTLTNSTAVARTLTVDFVLAANEVLR